MRVHVESLLACDAETAWKLVKTSAVLIDVSRPLVDIRPLPGESFPEIWRQGATVGARCYLFGFIPQGRRELFFERVDDAAREIQTREHDPLIRHWDHLLRVQSAGGGHCRYSDTVDIDAGWLTLLVWLFALCCYHHRHRRWGRLIRKLQKKRGDG